MASKEIRRARYTTNRVGLKSVMYPTPELTELPSHILGPVVYHARNIAKPEQNFAEAYGAPFANCLSI